MKLFITPILFLFSSLCLFGQGNIAIDDSNPNTPNISIEITAKQIEYLETNDLNKKGKEVLAVYLKTEKGLAPVPVSGKYKLEKTALHFSPIGKLGDGMSFEIYYYNEKDTLIESYATPAKINQNTAPALVENIFPLKDTVPSNILFFHVRFTQPMEEHIEAYKHINIIDSEGKKAEMVWRHKSYWLDEGKVLVLMIHPGRVKRGIKGKGYLGPIFEEGNAYQLVVTTGLKDAQGNQLNAEMKKTYIATADDYQIPKIKYKDFKLPKTGTKEPLVLKFSEGMDHAGIIDGIKIKNKGLVNGTLTAVADNLYQFNPIKAWEKGAYKVEFQKVVGDFAGNRLNRPFETTDVNDISKDNIPVKWEFTLK